MQVIFEHITAAPPKVSVVLLDWSCRESFHILDYLSNQTAPREQYEVIWVEYYNRRSPEISAKLLENEKAGRSPAIDQWIVLEMPEDVYYHKHLMYNVGILACRGKIVVICDSDALVKPTFIESIIKAFEQDPNIVLHMDEVRNVNKRFHPFNSPSFEEVLGEGCLNWRNGKTTGVLDKEDPLHTRNYGACMAALRSDLVDVGGADEHQDYLGHICGPYELTFRLANAGKKEVWHQSEFLYHVWHPGTNGRKNYLGPHDGYNMSTTALELLRSDRTVPLAENPAIKLLRTGSYRTPRAELLAQAISSSSLVSWKIDGTRQILLGCTAFLRRVKKKFSGKIVSRKAPCLPY